MYLVDALKELLHREWGDTEEVRFILNVVEEHYEEFESRKRVEEGTKAAMKVFDSFIKEILE